VFHILGDVFLAVISCQFDCGRLSHSRPVRAALIHWFKQHYLNIPVVALRFQSGESFPGADGCTVRNVAAGLNPAADLVYPS